jgi:hypothetical protein
MFSCLVEPLPPSLRWKSVTAKKCNFYNSKRSFMFWQVPAQLRRLFFLWGIVTPFSVFLASEGSATSFSTPPNRRDSHLGKTHPKICLTVLFLVNTYSHIQSRKYDIVLTGFELVTTLGYFAKLYCQCMYIHTWSSYLHLEWAIVGSKSHQNKQRDVWLLCVHLYFDHFSIL